jgi:pimeloyl-[acyl-carrier protein] synthase
MSLQQQVQRVLEPAVIRYLQWRGDPLARLVQARVKADPYPLYEGVRQRGLVRSSLGVWISASHATVSSVLRDPRFSSSPTHQPGYHPPEYPPGDPRAELPPADLLTLDPPDHTRLRRLVTRAFSARASAGLEPWIRDLTRQLVDRADPAGFDLVDAVAFPLPIGVICHLLGVPAADQDKFRVWGHAVTAELEPRIGASSAQDTREAELALTEYLRDLVARRRADPDDTLLSALIAAEDEGDRLSSAELVSTALLLLVAGFETTVNLIGNGTVALLSEPGSWARLAEQPALVPGAVEELLRYDSPVQLTVRTATEDVELGETVIRQGQVIVLLIGGANHDPGVFPEPGRLELERPNAAQHLAFSLGLHHCMGAALARLEGRVAFEELTQSFPLLQLAGPPARRPLLVLRGYESVPVSCPPASGQAAGWRGSPVSSSPS